ncbi:RDD family protein [Sedimentibacter sp. MB31-C6]|uniref:RDD family protein n=1 Tax=Sedimentibacter sp. MB31-C6 TaxID=3109366 RepID=UPI002DDD3A18|nr:RDD family protein [Sedimentibacter sp. MB36-C1]WSI05050.1 RDD family protein [Sedimentibacter sp. MB36-C1]
MTIKEIETLSGMEHGIGVPQAFYPWRRYLARMLDISIYNMFWSIFLIFMFNVNLLNRSNIGHIFDGFISLGIMLLLEPLCLPLFRTTPGKAIFGLVINTSEGRRLSYIEGLKRTWEVFGVGMGYNIPIYHIIRLWKSYELCSDNEIQPWDKQISYIKKDKKWYQGLLFVAAHVAIIAVLFTAISAQKLPPNRGDLTVTEFVENYNYYADLYDIDFGNKYLDKSGQWMEKALDGTTYIELGYSDMPEYNYTIENGDVTGVAFIIELKNNEDWISSYDNQMILASLSFAGAQDEVSLFSKVNRNIIDNIINNKLKNFEFIEANIEFICNVIYTGYINTYDGYLFPDKNLEENYFKLDYSINKLQY